MTNRESSTNPRLGILRREVEQSVLGHFRLHGWSAEIVREVNHGSYIVIAAQRESATTRIAVLYSSSENSNATYRALSNEVACIFFRGSPYMLDSFTRGVTVPVKPLSDFLPFLVEMNKQLDPDCSPASIPRRPSTVLRLTAENPLEAITARLQQFTSKTLAGKLVKRRAEAEEVKLKATTVNTKASGISYLMRGALDYVVSTPLDALNRKILGLYYGIMALAQAEMLASPSGPTDLEKVQYMTRFGHGLYTMPGSQSGFANFQVGVLKTGFFSEWMEHIGHNIADYPTKRPKSEADLKNVPDGMACSLRDLFASMPEIDDLFGEVFGGPPGWISVVHDTFANRDRGTTARKVGSTYCLFIDRSGKIPAEHLERARWPLAEIRQAEDHEGPGISFRARVDHIGHDSWWMVLPTHSSPFKSGNTLIFPTVGRIREYRMIAAVILYALSIMVRYMPSAWRRVEGGDEDQYLALVQTALKVWERLLPEHFLESIAGETVRTAQPGSWFA